MTRYIFDRLEFYITNVCNMTCSGCNRFNNYKFAGWQSWDEAEPILAQWAGKIDIRHPVILGGEPLLNPDIVKWIKGIRKLWPDHSGVQVQSNGTRIDRVPGLADALDPRQGNWLGISIHDPTDRENIFSKVRNFLGPTVVETQNFNDPIGSKYQFSNANKIKIHAWDSDKFVQSSIINLSTGGHTLHQSNANLAHENCTYRRFKNYHMIRGKIYKCGPAALLPEFDDQFPFNIDEQDRQLLHSYRPLTVDEYDSRGQEFLATIDDAIPQCKFCPENYDYVPITFGIKKVKSANW